MSIAVNSLRNIAVRSLTVVFLLLISVLTARLLGPEGSGVYALVTLYSAIGVALLGGLGTAAGRWISHLRRPVPEVVANVAALALLIGTGALALALLAYWLAGLLTGRPPPWLVYVGAAQPALLVAQALTWAFLGADDHHNYSYAIIAPSLLTLLCMAPALLLFRGSVAAAMLAWLAAQYAVIGWLWWRGRTVWTPLPLGSVTLASMGALVTFSAVSGLANLVSYLNYRVDMLMVERFLGTAQVGIYSKAVQLVEGLWFISQAVGVAIWSRVGAAPRAEAAHLVARSVRMTLVLLALAGLALLALSGLLIPLLFGGAFRSAVAPFRLFIPGAVAWGLANLFAAYYTNQLGRPRVPLAIAAVSLAVTAVTGPALIPTLGLAGGALATTLGYSTGIAVALHRFHRDTDIAWRELLLVGRRDLREAAITAEHVLARLARRTTPPATESEPAEEPLFRRVGPADRPAGERG
jgi:O-antigen/teichoic acid export membrane protein